MDGKPMKIGEFAARYGVSDRHARRLAAEHEADLVGHIEKRGNAGTWIDEYAEAYLRDKLRNPLEILPAEPEAVDPADLLKELNAWMTKSVELAEKLADAERRAAAGDVAVARLEAAEQRTLLLQDVHAESIERLKTEREAAEGRILAESALQISQRDMAIQAAETAIATLNESNQTLSDQLDEALDRAHVAEDKLAQIRAKTAELEHAGIFQRRKILRELRDLQSKE